DEVLVQVVPFGARRLVDELVLEQEGRLAVEVADGGQQARVAGQALAAGPDVGDGVERLEQALAGDDVRLPAAADVVRGDQVLEGEEGPRLFGDFADLLGRE